MSSESAESRQAVTNDEFLLAGVLPTLLCSACLCIFSGDPARFEYRDEMTGGWNQNTFSHHDTLGSFQASVKEGCYVCSRVNAQMRDQIEDALEVDYHGDACLWELPFSTYDMALGYSMEASIGEAELVIYIKLPNRSRGKHHMEFLLFSSDGKGQISGTWALFG